MVGNQVRDPDPTPRLEEGIDPGAKVTLGRRRRAAFPDWIGDTPDIGGASVAER
jgi:hypothetical protein